MTSDLLVFDRLQYFLYVRIGDSNACVDANGGLYINVGDADRFGGNCELQCEFAHPRLLVGFSCDLLPSKNLL